MDKKFINEMIWFIILVVLYGHHWIPFVIQLYYFIKFILFKSFYDLWWYVDEFLKVAIVYEDIPILKWKKYYETSDVTLSWTQQLSNFF